ncbi:MAG: circularly permuted type 2 ATP-grasp protein, partial [Actinomycetota bacterium]|nr:circularly permuted type 2 ATP-grasp protein [Actinomycetota bacterium]
VALLSDGPSNSAWYEHRALAAALDIPIVRADELTVSEGRLYARRDSGGPRAIDVIYRRTDEDRLRTADGEPTWVAEKLLEPLRAGTLAVVNPFGAGVADDKLAHAYVEDMVRFYCAEEPLIESVRSYDLGDPEVLDRVFGRLDELVVKPRSGHGGDGVVVCPRVSPRTREDVRRAVAAQPEAYMAQELVDLSTEPTVCEGRLEPRHVDLRPFVIGIGQAAVTAPVALTRVALTRGSLIVNSSRNGGGKDTWLLA